MVRNHSFEELLALAAAGLDVQADSRRVTPGGAFVAVRGVSVDGESFIPMALERGAAWIVASPSAQLPAGSAARLAVVDDVPRALGLLAAARHGTERLPFRLAGVTGTNGKTTVTYLVEHLFARAGLRAGVLGTVEYRWPGHSQVASHTTPDCLTLHALLAEMARDGVQGAAMEVSSHALDQGRVEGLTFDAAALTNVTQDHLDYHGDMEAYFQAKRRFFTRYLRDPSGAALNLDDASGRRLAGEFPQALGFTLTGQAAGGRVLSGRVLRSSGEGMELSMELEGRSWSFASPLIGAFNASNLLAAQALGLCLGLPDSAMSGLADCNGAPGRLERVPNGQGVHVFVDYAHTPDALENVLTALKVLDFTRVVALFGCGGNRDRSKRPLMAQAVARHADVAVLTSDNPRHEDPLAIIEDARPGLSGAARVIVEPDRRKAIALALEAAGKGGAALLAGKGHEPYQQIGDEKLPFSDALVAGELLA
ncbi:UDP-N-acetylmuramoyl-L-alanyl-D-glutamate--2, 6-diaminopimelate ligase [Fundidesulfovibrio magnetotacticus]|uniref:UDP-N-acetylmuramoyl-L-alanyl-D-glutamate--2,6-diaminopimelate ligase n=1 Tax=Fundidesulfovibrio magnetotacticus TaxID=2730080 RepID=A0A6V8LUR6_9BACT|nr:UDP-N-acetylmuramoyl-L-alanyl-D-glutamate--2,6-diaminopimelate ligase [Fundidesulfovibrio magnetotacticus]GFK93556.1 UDP-N-acetylmuramoyl-L-alanyl-D-glutamate--2, 6-diaminopimelate ligase [Fundidesulfovibrio magnetotacticus]